MHKPADNARETWAGMTVCYRNTPEDLLMLYEQTIRNSWSYQAARAFGSAISLSFVAYVLFLVYRGQCSMDSAFFLLFAASLMASLGRDAVKRTVRKNVERMSRSALRPRQLRIDADGLWVADQADPVAWGRVRGVLSNEHVIIIYFDNAAEVVPTRAFQDPFAAAAFAELARQFQADSAARPEATGPTAPPTEASEP